VGVLIDSSVLVAVERARPGVDRRVEQLIQGREDQEMYLSVITVSELLHGVHRAEPPARRARRSAFVERVLDEFPSLPIDLPTARVHAELWAQMVRSGHALSAHDLWIAAAALARGLLLVTLDARFSDVPGLDVEVWSI
jgi:tRNA(fMet)-specific endonuclease VapC